MQPNLLQLDLNKDKFHKHVIKRNGSACWSWIGHTDGHGYGLFQFRHLQKKFKIRAHRAAYILSHNRLLDRRITLKPLCDTTSCVNPEHFTEDAPAT